LADEFTACIRFHCEHSHPGAHADLNSTRVIRVGGVCFVNMGGATPPASGEAMVAHSGRHRGNRNRASST
jgi:hypothetical protein